LIVLKQVCDDTLIARKRFL